jgi:DNA-binding transcriptional LysR family regulator
VLVHRSTRGVTLTDAGRVLLATADAIHAELQIAAQQLRALQDGGPQALTVVTFASGGEPLLAPALTALTATAGRPDVRDLQIAPEPTRYIGAYLPRRHQPNPAAERLLAALRTHAAAVDGPLRGAPRL